MYTGLPSYLLESLLTGVPAFLFSLRRADLSLLWITDGAGPLTGFESRDLLARPELFADRLSAAGREGLRRLSGETEVLCSAPADLAFRCADGKARWLRACLVRAPGPPGDPDAVTGVAWSIDEVRGARREALLAQRILRTADVPVVFADVSGAVRHWNEAAERFFGWSAGEMEGKHLRALFLLPPPAMEALLRRACEEGTIRRDDVLATKSGVHVPCRLTLSLLSDEAGPLGIVATVAGTAEFLGLSNRLQEAIARLRIIEQVNRIIAAEWDIGVIHARIAEELAKLVDFDRTSFALFEEGQDRVLVRAYAKGCAEAEGWAAFPIERSAPGWVLERRIACIDDDLAASGEPFRENGLLSRKGMRSRIMIPLFAGARIVGALNFCSRRKGAYSLHTVEELGSIPDQLALAIDKYRTYERLKSSEEKYRLLFEQGPPAAITGPDGRHVDVNAGFLRLVGYTREEFLGLSTADIAADPADGALFADVGASGQPLEGEFRVRRRDGTRFWCAANIFPVSKDLVLGQVTDITPQRELEGQLRHAQKMEAVGTLAGGIAHDFNNIIQAIMGYTSLLKSRIGERGELAGQVDAIEQASLRAAELTSQLLGFARGGKYEVRACDLYQVIEKVVAMIRPTFDRSIDIRTELSAAVSTVEGDAGQLEHALLNLCINARDAMPSGGTLRIAVRNEPVPGPDSVWSAEGATGASIVLSVSDDGVGIAPEILPRIFEPFFTTKEPGKGTGMGLAMVYGIVKNHGGRIEVRSDAGGGTTFRIVLPVSPDKPEPLPAAAAPSTLPRGNETILFVDDEESLRLLAVEMLGGLGYTVHTAQNGLVALNLFAERQADINLVILDLIMPEMGGAETFRKIREIDPSARVLVSSGYAAEGRTDDLLAEGAAGFIKKPYRLAALAGAVRRALQGEP